MADQETEVVKYGRQKILGFPIEGGETVEIWTDSHLEERDVKIFRSNTTWVGMMSQLAWDSAMTHGHGADLLNVVGRLVKYHARSS